MDLLSGRRSKSRQQTWGDQLRELTGNKPVQSIEELLREFVASQDHELVLLEDGSYLPHGGPCGLWLHIPQDKIDVVWVDPSLGGLHRDAVLGHELGHMINGDRSSHLDPAALLAAAASSFKHLSPEFVAGALQRRVYNNRAERLAETFGTWVTARIDEQHTAPADVVLTRVRGSLATRQQYW